ncbi:MAG: hypothetical protein CVV28_11310 [Methanobacteriales archaeon HGW-Methanobacteriales-1]|jgi:hypothetical protein|nr:MAG: hypothetical protein CVV28_11310 [Methanobacteriales archaeon HGW-Methanobacteriales-1]
MSDKPLIHQIKDLMNKNRNAELIKDENIQKQCLEQVLIIYDKLSNNGQKRVKNELYVAHRNLGSLYINEEFEKALHHLELAKSLSSYKNENFFNKCNLNRLISHLKMKIGLKEDSKDQLAESRNINNLLLSKLDKISLDQLKNEIMSDKLILDAIEKGDIKTIIEFELPIPLFIKDKYPIEFEINGIKYTLEVEIVENPLFVKCPNFTEIMEDKYGLANRSKIKLTIFRYIDPNKRIKISTFSEKECILYILSEAINAINYFIERYRIISGNYWVETVFYNMISEFSSTIMAGDHIIRNIPINMDQLIRCSPNPPWLSDLNIDNLDKYLRKEEIILWEILLLDAEDFLLRRNYREAIYAINGCFENFLMIKAREKLKKSWDDKEVEDYLNGSPVYENFKLKKYLSEDLFNQAVSNKDIFPYVPSTFQILKKCNEIDPSKVEIKELNRLVSKIRKKRNDIMHGVEIAEDLEKLAFEAIKSFKEFTEVF